MKELASSVKLKAVAVLEVIKEQRTIEDISKTLSVDITTLLLWKQDFLDNMEFFFLEVQEKTSETLEQYRFEQKMMETLRNLKIENNDLRNRLISQENQLID